MTDQVETFLKEGREMLEKDNLEDYDRWRNSILFFVERHGTPTMIEKIKKEVNRGPLFITYPGDTQDLGAVFKRHKLEQIKKIGDLITSLSPYLRDNNISKSHRNNQKRFFSLSVKNHVWQRQEGKCLRCKGQLSPAFAEYDHVISWESGGKSTEENCQALCANCHKVKTNEDRVNKQGKGVK